MKDRIEYVERQQAQADDEDVDAWAAYAGGDDPHKQDLARRDAMAGTAPAGWRGFVQALREFGRE